MLKYLERNRDAEQTEGRKNEKNLNQNKHRGHNIIVVNHIYYYVDTGQNVADNPDRECGHCGKSNTIEGYDGCIGKIDGVMNACCGHGSKKESYIQYKVDACLKE